MATRRVTQSRPGRTGSSTHTFASMSSSMSQSSWCADSAAPKRSIAIRIEWAGRPLVASRGQATSNGVGSVARTVGGARG